MGSFYEIEAEAEVRPTIMTGIEHGHARYLSLVCLVQQLGAAVEHKDVILTLGFHTGHVIPTPISHVSLG